MKKSLTLLTISLISITAFGQTNLSIYDIQYTTDPSGNSSYKDSIIITNGLVTAIGSSGYFIQNGDSAWSGVYVYDNTNTPSLGDSLTLTAQVDEYNKLTELKSVSSYQVNSSGNPLPTPVSIATDTTNNEMYEGVLVKVSNANCTNASSGFGQWVVDDGSGEVFVDDMMFAYTPIQNSSYDVTGLMHYSFSEWKIEPRDANDIVGAVAPIPMVTIAEIQGGVASSPYNNQMVMTTGIATGYSTYAHPTDPNKDYRGYFIQAGDSAWSGIWVSDSVNYNNITAGDSVFVRGMVNEFFGYTRIEEVDSFALMSTGNPEPSPMNLSTLEANDEKYEGVLIEVINANCDSILTFGEWKVDDGSGDLIVDDLMYGGFTPVLNDNYDVAGVMFYSFSKRQLQPRKPSDVDFNSSITNQIAGSSGFSVFPNPTDGVFNVKLDEKTTGVLRIIDNQGREIYAESIRGKSTVTIDLNSYAKGIYLARLDTKNSVKSKKLIVK